MLAQRVSNHLVQLSGFIIADFLNNMLLQHCLVVRAMVWIDLHRSRKVEILAENGMLLQDLQSLVFGHKFLVGGTHLTGSVSAALCCNEQLFMARIGLCGSGQIGARWMKMSALFQPGNKQLWETDILLAWPCVWFETVTRVAISGLPHGTQVKKSRFKLSLTHNHLCICRAHFALGLWFMQAESLACIYSVEAD